MAPDPRRPLQVLLIEDDDRLRQELKQALRSEGFSVTCASDLREARLALTHPQDLVLLDLGLPDGDGLDLCRDLRHRGDTVPVLIMTARDEVGQRVDGLDAGADDYLVKPFHLDELNARMRSILRRTIAEEAPATLELGGLLVDQASHTVKRDGKEVILKPREFELLVFLLSHADRVWTRHQLLQHVWGDEMSVGPRTVDMHVRRLRIGIEEDPSDPRLLQTVWGVGYRMATAEEIDS